MKKERELKSGFSTGTAAAAATGAAARLLLGLGRSERVSVALPAGGEIEIEVAEVEPAGSDGTRATVVKDGGDDPDATHKARITATVCRAPAGAGIALSGGPGVGRVTRPGLPVAVGQPAINPVPREMIGQAAQRAWERAGLAGPVDLSVEISVERGEEIARHTLNPRLGILGGISILGTTGLVKPFSHEAYTATIASALDVLKAAGETRVVFTTGGKSEKLAMAMLPGWPETCFVQIADFFGYALAGAAERDFRQVGLVSFFGKAVKQAQDLDYTHAHKAPMDLAALAAWLQEAGEPAELAQQVREANTARQVLEILRERGKLSLAPLVGRRMLAATAGRAGERPLVWVKVLDYDGGLLYEGRREGAAGVQG